MHTTVNEVRIRNTVSELPAVAQYDLLAEKDQQKLEEGWFEHLFGDMDNMLILAEIRDGKDVSGNRTRLETSWAQWLADHIDDYQEQVELGAVREMQNAPLPEHVKTPPVDEDDEGDAMGVRERDDRFAQE
jgi:hypothetical protein